MQREKARPGHTQSRQKLRVDEGANLVQFGQKGRRVERKAAGSRQPGMTRHRHISQYIVFVIIF
jgi:hypothetical protein